jgi:hypothetical protein
MDEEGLTGQSEIGIVRRAFRFISSSTFVTPRKLYYGFFARRSMVLFFWAVFSVYMMNIFNAFVYSRMPVDYSLPDIIMDAFPAYGRLRGSGSYMKNQPADMLSVFLTVSSSLVLIIFWEKTNVRKLGVVYCLSVHLRTILFTVTGLPPPCIGYPNCPCSTIPWASVSEKYSVPKIAFIYTFAMGLFLGSVPQCGDLTMSGHTIYLWVLALFFLETMSRVTNNFLFFLIKLVIYLSLLFVTVTIVLIRNHYTIDIVLATTFVNMFWWWYGQCEDLVDMKWGPFVNTWFGKVFIWITEKPSSVKVDTVEGGIL